MRSFHCGRSPRRSHNVCPLSIPGITGLILYNFGAGWQHRPFVTAGRHLGKVSEWPELEQGDGTSPLPRWESSPPAAEIALGIGGLYNAVAMAEGYDYAILGGLRRDYIITAQDRVHAEVLGGNAVYGAAGAGVWATTVGIIGRAGYDFQLEFLGQLERKGIHTKGITYLPERETPISFYAYETSERRVSHNPAPHFLRLNLPLPKPLIDYESSESARHDRHSFLPFSLRPDDLPNEMARCKAAHLGPGQFLTHFSVPVRLRELGVPLITLAPSEDYLEPAYLDDLRLMLTGIDVFMPNEAQARGLFSPSRPSPWEMAEAFGDMGVPFVVVRCGERGCCLWDSESRKRWRIPCYPTRAVDTTGAGSAFCGGFLVGFERTHDPLQAALLGSVSASLTIEGTGGLFALDVLPGLPEARLRALRRRVVPL
jgi:sugar/nucleoside kinase (ribokinase family)